MSIELEAFELIKETLAAIVPFAEHVGIVVEAVGDGVATATLPESETNKNHIGTQHAGALFTVAESASGAAMAGLLAPFIAEANAIVRRSSSRYLRPARGPITATASTSRDTAEARTEYADNGRTAFTVDVALTDSGDVTVATMNFEWIARAQTRPTRD